MKLSNSHISVMTAELVTWSRDSVPAAGRWTKRPRSLATTRLDLIEGTCIGKLERSLGHAQAWGQPILAVLDSWGNAPISFNLLQRIAQNPSSEVIVTLGPQQFMRFVSKLGQEADEVLGVIQPGVRSSIYPVAPRRDSIC
jgi:hypothetical protein